MINLKKKKKKKTINRNQNYKKEKKSTREGERKREREREYLQFFEGKYGLNGINDIEFIQNRMERRRVKIEERENDKRSMIVK